MATALRVGIIGASASGGWARDSHVPAVQGLEGLRLVAVATNSQTTADEAAHAFGVDAAYPSGLDMIRSAEIDIVTVATRVPDHRELVLAALAAGKHVYCEWPLGRSLAEAETMSAAVRAAGVQAAIGLQLRGNPVVHRSRELIMQGAIGRLLSVTMSSATAGFGPVVPAPFAYLEDPSHFANLITIQAAHTIDMAIAIVGGLMDLNGLATAQFPMVTVGDDPVPRPRTTFDHLLLQARFTAGGVLDAEVAGGRPPDTPFVLTAVGTSGVLKIDGGAMRGFQSGRLTLSLNGEPQSVDDGELASLSDAAANVAGVYAALRDGIRSGMSSAADFEHAARLTRLVLDVLDSSKLGRRVRAGAWPRE